MNQRDRSRLWSGIESYGTATAGRTEWTVGGYSWLVRSRVLGDNWPTRKTPLEQRCLVTVSNRSLRDTIARYAGGQRCRIATGIMAERDNGDVDLVAVAYHHFWSDPARSNVRVPLNPSWALGMEALVHAFTAGKFQTRVEPHRGSVSWWTTSGNPYPLAVLLGIHGARLTFPETRS